MQVEYVEFLLGEFVFCSLFEVFCFGCKFFEFEAEEVTEFFYFIYQDVGCVVFEGSCSDFDLFDVAESFVFGALTYGEYAVKEVVEFLGSCEVVLGDGAHE